MAGERFAYVVKLVRDRIAERVGGDPRFHYKKLDGPFRHEQHVKLLRAKLMEEATEYLLDPSVGELADVLEVCEALARVDLGVSPIDVINAQREKREERGGFEDGTVMVATDDGAVAERRPEWEAR